MTAIKELLKVYEGAEEVHRALWARWGSLRWSERHMLDASNSFPHLVLCQCCGNVWAAPSMERSCPGFSIPGSPRVTEARTWRMTTEKWSVMPMDRGSLR